MTLDFQYTYADYAEALESANLFMMYPSEVNFLMIAKRAMEPGEVEQLRQWVRGWEHSFAAGFPVVSIAKLHAESFA